MRPSHYLFALSTLLGSLNVLATNVENYSILNSFASGYKSGEVLSDSQIINLQKGEKLQVKSLKTEEKCDIIGPYASQLKCARLMLAADPVRPRQRSASSLPPSIWALDVQHGHNFCYRNPEQLQLWRSDAAIPIHLNIQAHNSEDRIRLRWPANQTLLDWPAKKLPLVEGSTYIFNIDSTTVAVNFHQLPETVQNRADLFDWMQQQGCSAQLDVLQSSGDLLLN